jgi:hypothetical protein
MLGSMRRIFALGSTWAASLLVVACGGGVAVGTATAPAAVGSCGAESRPQLDCSTEFKYDAINVQGELKVGPLGSLQGNVEQKALHEIDKQTGLYVAEARRLCDEYNKCVVDKDTYGTRSENLRRRLAQTPELLDEVKSATTEDAQRVALAKAYHAVVPDSARTELRVDFSVLGRRPDESVLAPIAADAALPSGSHVAFNVDLSKPAYVYLFQKSAGGAIHVLFPDSRIPIANPIQPGAPLQIPQGGQSFKLDDKDLGTERVYIVASLKPVASLAAAADQASKGAQPGSAIQRVTAIDGACKSRGLSLDEGAAPSGGCARPRGLSLDVAVGGGAKASMTATTEAADDTIATVFSFRHTR